MSEDILDLSKSSGEKPPPTASSTSDAASSGSGQASSDTRQSDIQFDTQDPGAAYSLVTSLPLPFLRGSNSKSDCGPSSSKFFPPAACQVRSDSAQRSQHPASFLTNPLTSSDTRNTGFFRGSSKSVEQTAQVSRDDNTKPSTSFDRISDARIAPVRPFRTHPMDPFGVYNNALMVGSSGTLSPTVFGLQSLYDTPSSPSFPSLAFTPLTSRLLQRKRRAESREAASTSTSSAVVPNSSSSTRVISNAGSSSTRIMSSAGSSTSDKANSKITTSSLSSKDDSHDSDGDGKETSSAEVTKDVAYWERRRKNNEAAKRSRDARRQKEEEIALRAAYLEQENLKLKAQIAVLKNETAKLHYMLYNRI